MKIWHSNISKLIWTWMTRFTLFKSFILFKQWWFQELLPFEKTFKWKFTYCLQSLWMHTTLGMYFWALKITKYMHLLFIGFWGRNISLLFLWINLPVKSSSRKKFQSWMLHDIQNSAKGKDYVQVGTYFLICVPLTLLRCYNICCRLYVSPC